MYFLSYESVDKMNTIFALIVFLIVSVNKSYADEISNNNATQSSATSLTVTAASTSTPESKLSWTKRGLNVFFKICGKDKIPDADLYAAYACNSVKKELNQTTVKICNDEVYEGKTLQEIRRIRCFKKTRTEVDTKFAYCYLRENPESTAEQKEKYEQFKVFPKKTQQTILKQTLREYTTCVEKALKL